MTFDAAAEELRRQEYARLAAAMPPRPEQLRSMTTATLSAEAARMWDGFGHQIITRPDAPELVHVRSGRKYITICGNPADPAPAGSTALRRLRDRVVAAGAEKGFYLSVRGFTAEAGHFAKSAPVQLIDCARLIRAIAAGRNASGIPPVYKAMCRQCGDIVQHSLDNSAPKCCARGHSVPQPIARGDFEKPPPAKPAAGPSKPLQLVRYHDMSPKAQTRRAINAHNYRLWRKAAGRPHRSEQEF